MLQLGVIGCGSMASAIAEKCVALGRAKITAIYDPILETRTLRSNQFKAEPISQIECLLDRNDIDAFLIGSPGFYHYDNLMAIVGEGKPVFCEKPLSTTVERCSRMIEACHNNGVKLFVGQVLRLFPLFWKSQEVLESGVIGEPRLCSITRTMRKSVFDAGWRSDCSLSGGLLLEVNSHELDYMLWLLGDAETVYAQGIKVDSRCGCNDTFLVQINFKSGSIGMLHSSNASPIGQYQVHIQATQGNMVHGGFAGELEYRTFTDTESTKISLSDLSASPDPFEREILSFFDWVEHNTPPLFTGETGRANVAIAEAAYESICTGKPEPVLAY